MSTIKHIHPLIAIACAAVLFVVAEPCPLIVIGADAHTEVQGPVHATPSFGTFSTEKLKATSTESDAIVNSGGEQIAGQVVINGTDLTTTFNYRGDASEEVTINGGKTASGIHIGNSTNTGGVFLGSDTNDNRMQGTTIFEHSSRMLSGYQAHFVSIDLGYDSIINHVTDGTGDSSINGGKSTSTVYIGFANTAGTVRIANATAPTIIGGSVTAGTSTSTHTLNGNTVFPGTNNNSVVNYLGDGSQDTYLQGGLIGSSVRIAPNNISTTFIGRVGSPVRFLGDTQIDGTATFAGNASSIGGSWALTSTGVKTTSGAQWSAGANDPNGAVTGNVGDLFSRTNGGAGSSLYVKESGNGTNTGWVGK